MTLHTGAGDVYWYQRNMCFSLTRFCAGVPFWRGKILSQLMCYCASTVASKKEAFIPMPFIQQVE